MSRLYIVKSQRIYGVLENVWEILLIALETGCQLCQLLNMYASLSILFL